MALPPYKKRFLTVPQQLALLQERGLSVTDYEAATRCLERFGYYRLSGYWYPMRQSRVVLRDGVPASEILDRFRDGSKFSHAADLCVFDKRLRLLVLDAIDRIEVALRVDIAHLLGARDPCGHLNPKELHGNFTIQTGATGETRYAQWLHRLAEIEDRSKEDYVKHFRAKYSGNLPLWISIELWDFGMLSVFFSGMKYDDREAIAAKYAIPRSDLLASWARALNHTRNICAHHGRLWNRSPSDQPKSPRPGEIPSLDHLADDSFSRTRLYAVAATSQFLLKRLNPASTWGARLKAHALTFPAAPGTAFHQAGFPLQWETLPLWEES